MKKILLSIFILTLLSCNKDDDEENSVQVLEPVAFFKGSLDGQPFDYNQAEGFSPTHVNKPIYGFIGAGFERSFFYASSMELFATTEDFPSVSITLHSMYTSTSYSDETENFNNSFASIPTNFITNDQESNFEKGVSVSYVDANEKYYTSLSGSQENSTVNYSSIVPGRDAYGYQYQTVKGTVNCKLYNYDDPTDVIVVTNGSFKLVFNEFE